MKKLFTLIATMAAAAALHAAPITGTLTLNGYQHGSAAVGTVTKNDPGFAGLHPVTAAISGLNATFNDGLAPENFLIWCIELLAPTANFGTAANYTQNFPGLGAFSNPFDAITQTRLEKLFTKQFIAHGSDFADDTTTSAAVQLSIWEILYSGAGFGDLHTTNNIFQNTNGFWSNGSLSGARGEAEGILAGLDAFDNSGYAVSFTSFNSGGNKTGKQDFLAVTVDQDFGGCQGNDACEVPEPTGLALAGGALVALGLVRRRKTEVVTEDDQA